MFKKLPPFPDWLMVTPCMISVEGKGVTEDGEPPTDFEWSGKCWHSDKAQESLDGNGKKVILQGAIQIKGDIAPGLASFSGGTVAIGNANFQINKGMRPKNPDGTVHHTTLELI